MSKTQRLVDGRWVDDVPHPFYVRTILGSWLPVCTKHKLIFRNEAHYVKHAEVNDCTGGEILTSDHKRHLKGYKNAN